MAKADPAFTGETINGYRIVQKLGSGGMGLVFRALDTRLNRHVALKFLPEDLELNQRARSLLLTEAQAASALDHPNVGTIYGMEQTPTGRMFIVMAFYNGETLADRIAREGALSADETIRIAEQIASGLAEAHANQVVHRDVKPSNIMLTPQGGVKILDFGLARILSSASVTQSIGLSGTVAYMSPEQALGRALDARTDLWSLGVTMYEMATGQLPFEADNNAATLMAIVHEPPSPLGESVSPALQRMVYRLLVKDPAGRYPDAKTLEADLKRAAAASTTSRGVSQSELNRLRSLVAKPIALTARSLTPVERWSIGGLCVLLLAVAGVIALLVRRAPPRGAIDANVEHVAVLPLQTRGTNASDGEISEGLRESITDRLSNLQAADRSLWVVPASEVSAHKVQSPAEAHKAYGANLVVLGRLEREGSIVRLRLELVDVNRNRQLGAVDAESTDGNLSELEDAAVEQLESRMGLSPANSQAAANAPVVGTAYEQYLKALPLIDQWDKPRNLDRASALLASAIKQDPSFTLAFVSLANVDLIRYRATQNRAWLVKATTYCDRAQRLNSQLPGVHVMLGQVQDASGRYELALQEFKRALDLEPNSADATLGMALVYDHEGRTKDAEDAFRRAIDLRPEYWGGYNQLGGFYERHNRHAEAMAEFKHAIQLAPDSRTPYANLAAVLMDTGHLADALPALEKASALAPSYGVSANLAVAYFRQKRFPEAEQANEDALKMNDKDWRVWTNLAAVRRWRHEEDAAREADLRALPLMESESRLKQQDPDLQVTLGVVEADLGRDKEAESHMRTAMALASGNGNIEAAAAEIEARLGHHKQAVALFEKAVHDGALQRDFAMDPDMQSILADPEVSKLKQPNK
jgi:tetratricopeptide (TPR) repeat protein